MPWDLDLVEVRVLGALLEKEITTPEYYPMTLNALTAACNQKNNRDPVVSYDEDTVADALASLRERRLTTHVTGAGNRVPKYGHRLAETLNLGRRETALLCVLMLRGPQTPGELRGAAERMHRFSDLDEVLASLQKLIEREPEPLVVNLGRPSGRKEDRYAHLLSGEPSFAESQPQSQVESRAAASSRLEDLEAEVRTLRSAVQSLEEQFAAFRKQFE